MYISTTINNHILWHELVSPRTTVKQRSTDNDGRDHLSMWTFNKIYANEMALGRGALDFVEVFYARVRINIVLKHSRD